MAKIQTVFEKLHDRLGVIEGVVEGGQGKNVVYDRIMEVCNNAEVERLQFTQVCKSQIEKMSDALEKLELRIEAHQMQIEAQDKMHSNIYKRVTDTYASQEAKNSEMTKQLAKLVEEAGAHRSEARAALRRKDVEVSDLSGRLQSEEKKLNDCQ